MVNGSTTTFWKAERRRSRTYQRMGYMRLPVLKTERVGLNEAVGAESAPPIAPPACRQAPGAGGECQGGADRDACCWVVFRFSCRLVGREIVAFWVLTWRLLGCLRGTHRFRLNHAGSARRASRAARRGCLTRVHARRCLATPKRESPAIHRVRFKAPKAPTPRGRPMTVVRARRPPRCAGGQAADEEGRFGSTRPAESECRSSWSVPRSATPC